MAMTLRLTDEEDALLAALAAAEGVSKQEAAKRAIVGRAQQLGHREAVAEAGREAITRYASLLERLAQ